MPHERVPEQEEQEPAHVSSPDALQSRGRARRVSARVRMLEASMIIDDRKCECAAHRHCHCWHHCHCMPPPPRRQECAQQGATRQASAAAGGRGRDTGRGILHRPRRSICSGDQTCGCRGRCEGQVAQRKGAESACPLKAFRPFCFASPLAAEGDAKRQKRNEMKAPRSHPAAKQARMHCSGRGGVFSLTTRCSGGCAAAACVVGRVGQEDVFCRSHVELLLVLKALNIKQGAGCIESNVHRGAFETAAPPQQPVRFGPTTGASCSLHVLQNLQGKPRAACQGGGGRTRRCGSARVFHFPDGTHACTRANKIRGI